ncbi:hypothetical protein MHYP_G00076240 [Metynnis hypsauchen]
MRTVVIDHHHQFIRIVTVKIHISVNGQAGLPFSISPSRSLDVWGGTIWQAAVCHAGELAVGKCATGQASVTPLTGLAQVSVKTDGRGRYRNGRQGGEIRSPGQNGQTCVITQDKQRHWH